MHQWEWLEGIKLESAIDVAVRETAKLIAEQLTSWPPTGTDVGADSRFAEVLAPGAPRPSKLAYDEATKRARWELLRDFDAIDFYERNHHLAKACPAPRDRLASEFMRHYILEFFFELMERTDYRIKRRDLVPGLDTLEQRFHVALHTN